MKIELINTKEELNVFPIDGSLKLSSNEQIEKESFLDSVSLFRLIDDQGLFNFGDKYNQSIGYVREEFTTVDYKFTEEVKDGKYVYSLKPTLLHPNSNYALFIDKNIGTSAVVIEKINSKSNSTITIKTETVLKDLLNSEIEVIANPVISATSNIIKLQYSSTLSTKVVLLDLKKQTELKIDGLVYKFKDYPYLLGEKFIFTFKYNEPLSSNLIQLIKTSIHSDTTQIDKDDASSTISTDSILEYYKSKDKVEQEDEDLEPETYEEELYFYKYIGYNKIRCRLKAGLTVDDIDFDSLEFETNECFDLYTLEQYGYYNPDKNYTVAHKILNKEEFLLIITEV